MINFFFIAHFLPEWSSGFPPAGCFRFPLLPWKPKYWRACSQSHPVFNSKCFYDQILSKNALLPPSIFIVFQDSKSPIWIILDMNFNTCLPLVNQMTMIWLIWECNPKTWHYYFFYHYEDKSENNFNELLTNFNWNAPTDLLFFLNGVFSSCIHSSIVDVIDGLQWCNCLNSLDWLIDWLSIRVQSKIKNQNRKNEICKMTFSCYNEKKRRKCLLLCFL